MPHINIYHLYPQHLNLCGDRGNILALLQRSRWHGLETRVVPVPPGGRIDFRHCDLLYMGGGQDSQQKIVVAALRKYLHELRAAVEAGLVVLAISGSYQLLGRYIVTAKGERIPGLNLLDFYTTGGKRIAGDIVTSCSLWSPPKTLVGFENHSGRTFLGKRLKPLGKVLRGYGNNGRDGTEGVRYKNVIGTYMHGALLPKNPWLTDCLLKKALEYRQINCRLKSLDDKLELAAHKFIINRNSTFFFRKRRSSFYEAK
ncbi:MAG TPA: glutamine amidotransferase [Firmicutes bacterium]|nr:glutamine amidotransferase [Bacillota bacterium]